MLLRGAVPNRLAVTLYLANWLASRQEMKTLAGFMKYVFIYVNSNICLCWILFYKLRNVIVFLYIITSQRLSSCKTCDNEYFTM
jgi:hypothetical protein